MKKRILIFFMLFSVGLAAMQANVKEIKIAGQIGEAKIDTKNKRIFILVGYYYQEDLYPLKKAKLEKIVTENNVPHTLPAFIDLRDWSDFKVGNENWKIKGGYQLPESDFNTWHSETIQGFITLGKVTCDQMVGSTENAVWDNGNPAYSASGSKNWPTQKVLLNDGTYAAELQTRSILGIIASGNLFTGRVVRDMSLTQLMGFTSKDGKSLIDWGVPFEARPESFRVKMKYEGLGDSCTIMITLENRIGKTRRFVGVAWYSAATDHDTSKEGVIHISEPDENGLRTLEAKVIYGRQHKNADPLPTNCVQGEADEPITHVNVVFASSQRGDYFKGKKNAKLTVKDFELIY